uniref:Uncharacterized protein n=1 Tax=Molossus molossus TaxID=27622 RepID=A0A7J8BN58_MOLMO|nr:hypothetical protein HJG59_004575 [Molossus molossus]
MFQRPKLKWHLRKSKMLGNLWSFQVLRWERSLSGFLRRPAVTYTSGMPKLLFSTNTTRLTLKGN